MIIGYIRFLFDVARTYRALKHQHPGFDDLRAMADDPDDDIEHYSDTAKGLRPCKDGCTFCHVGDVLTPA